MRKRRQREFNSHSRWGELLKFEHGCLASKAALPEQLRVNTTMLLPLYVVDKANPDATSNWGSQRTQWKGESKHGLPCAWGSSSHRTQGCGSMRATPKRQTSPGRKTMPVPLWSSHCLQSHSIIDTCFPFGARGVGCGGDLAQGKRRSCDQARETESYGPTIWSGVNDKPQMGMFYTHHLLSFIWSIKNWTSLAAVSAAKVIFSVSSWVSSSISCFHTLLLGFDS